jgi:hypothetical protein
VHDACDVPRSTCQLESIQSIEAMTDEALFVKRRMRATQIARDRAHHRFCEEELERLSHLPFLLGDFTCSKRSTRWRRESPTSTALPKIGTYVAAS